MARLVVVTQGLAGLSHELNGAWTTIGREEGNSFKIADVSVSATHCEVRLRGDELLVRDLCSTNGTFFQGKRIIETVLKPGQVLRVGEVDVRFETGAPGRPAGFSNRMLVGAQTKVPSVYETKLESPAEPETKPDDYASKKYQVLFVDDSRAFLETFSELCSTLASQTWGIHLATSADQALATLQRFPIDLAVLDIGIPMVDGIQLLGIIKRRYPSVRTAVLTGKATESNRASCLSGDADLFIEKPISSEGMRMIFNMLNELVSWPRREGFSGTLHRVGLQEVIQMECIGRRSAILEVRNHETFGQIYIETGAITHAVAGNLDGVKAFNKMLSLSGGEFRMRPFEPPPRRTVDQSWECLLMEAARCCDEETSLLSKSDVEAPAKPPATPPPPPAETKPGEPEDDFVVVATYDGEWTPVDPGNG